MGGLSAARFYSDAVRFARDSDLLGAARFYGYNPSGAEGAFLDPHKYEMTLKEIEKRGLELYEGVPDFATVQADISAVRSLRGGGGGARLREMLAEHQQVAEITQARAAKDEQVARVEQIIAEFEADNSYTNLLTRIRELPPTISPELQQRLRNQAAGQVRLQEANRLKKLGAAIGLRGLSGTGGGAAFLANQAAASADSDISSAFNQIRIQALMAEQQDEIKKMEMESGLVQQRLTTEMALNQALAQAEASQVPDVTTPILNYSAYLQARQTEAAAQEAASEA